MHTRRISPWVPVFTLILLIFIIDRPNSTLNVNPRIPRIPKKRWAIVLVEASVQSTWSDWITPLPSLKFVKNDVSNLLTLPVSSATRFPGLPFWGQRAFSVGRNEGLIEGSDAPTVPLKLNNLFTITAQPAVPIVCPPVYKTI